MTEDHVLQELQNGSEAALSWFIHQYTPYVTSIIHTIIGNYMDISDVEETAAEVFFTLWKHARDVSNVKGFLAAVARNKAKNKLREFRADLSLEDCIQLPDGTDLTALAEQKELSRVVKQAIQTLSYPDREIFLRFYYYYQHLEDISREMKIPLSTVKSKLRRGREKLKQELTHYFT